MWLTFLNLGSLDYACYSIVSTVDLYQKILKVLAKQEISSIQRGATPSAIDSLENDLGIDLPVGLSDLYLQYDGEGEGGGDVFSDYTFLSISEIYSAIDSLSEDALQFSELEKFPCYPAGTIKRIPYVEYWVPFAGNSAGNYIGVDMDPGENGVSGQVINFGTDEFFRVQIADCFETFLEKLLCGYLQKRYHSSFSNSINIVDTIIGDVQG